MTGIVSQRSPTTAVDVQWIKSLIERKRAPLGAMLVQLGPVRSALADRNAPADDYVNEQDARSVVEAVADRLSADDERLGALAQHVAQTWNGEPA